MDNVDNGYHYKENQQVIFDKIDLEHSVGIFGENFKKVNMKTDRYFTG